MRNFTKSILFLGIAALFFTSCEKDEFTEKDAMDELQHIDVVINVSDGSSYADVVEGATVQLVGDSTTSSRTTDNGGNVTFTDVRVGTNLSVYVSKDNFTKLAYSLSTLTNSYRENIITKNLKIYSLNSENMATVKGKLTLETDLTNRKREVLSGQEVRVVNNSLDGGNERSFVGITDEEGNYSVKVPVTPQGGDDLQVNFPSMIEADQTLAVENEDGTYGVVTVPATYYSNYYDYSSINNSISSAQAVIDAPTGNGTGFSLGVEAKPTAFSEYSNIEIVKGGSGYTADTLSLSAGVNGLSAQVIVYVDGNGAITDMNFYRYFDYSTYQYVYLDNGALYTSAPTLDLSSLGGSGAELDLEFEGEYLVYIENSGEGYFSIPYVSAEYKEYQGNTLVSEYDNSISGYGGNELSNSYYSGLSNFLKIHDGAIYANQYAYDGDTLFVTKGLADIPELTVSETSAGQATLDLGVSSNGEIYINSWNDGAGYDPANPPQVTVISIAGYGSGAEIKAEVGTDGSISNFSVLDSGEGYVRNVNDFDGNGFDTFNPGESYSLSGGYKYIGDISAGDIEVRDVYYGTGIRE